MQYRQGGRSRRFRVGEHGRLTPEEARALAKRTLAAVEVGHDPVGSRRIARSVRTFAELANDFMASHVRSKRKASTADAYEITLRVHILPRIGSLPVSDVDVSVVSNLHLRLIDNPATANKALAIISSAWRWAQKRGEPGLGSNPVPAIDKYTERRRERFLTTEELGRLGEALRRAESVGLDGRPGAERPGRVVFDSHAVAAIRLLALTGARLRELLHLRWEHVDFGRGVLLLPDSKTGAKTIYLSEPALDVLRGVRRLNGNPYVFPGTVRGAARHDLKRPWAAITRAADLSGLRLHDLRHSFASIGAGAQMGLPILGKLLGHTQSATTQRYAHLASDPLHLAANTIATTIAAAMSQQRGSPNKAASQTPNKKSKS